MLHNLLICDCGFSAHQLIFSSLPKEDYEDFDLTVPEDREIIISVHLSPFGLWKRIKYAWNYIIGKSPSYGGFEEVLTTESKLQEVINKLKSNT